MNADPFGTAALRDGVLAAWRGSPTRFREDANTESDLALVGYADRLLVELAQNAADAAQRAAAPGHLRVTVEAGELRAANTGAPLDSGGVAALAALRASAKRGARGSVGRFGVGFAAVLGVTDAPRVVSTSGGVRFSAEHTARAVAGDPPLRTELRRRGGRPPVLRLVWPTEDEPPLPPGFATEVRLPLRPGIDPDVLLETFANEAGDLLLALPWLCRIDIGDRKLRREGDDPVLVHDGTELRRWRVVHRAGLLPAPALAGLGAEARPEWNLCWALPVDADGSPQPLAGEVLHAPTPTAERLTLPARLIGTVPVDASRRHVHPGAATDLLLRTAARAYPELAAALTPDQRTALVPEPGFPAGEVDAALRDAVLEALRAARWLPAATGGDIAPAGAMVLDVPLPELAALLADVTPNLLDAELAAPGHARALAALGVARLRPAAIAELLAGLDRPASWWRCCYAALAPLLDVDPAAREELGALPVPLADGRTVTGPRGVLLGDVDLGSPADDGASGAVTTTELRLVHPDAVHPLLERLGARQVGPAELLDALRPAVERSVDDAEDGLDVTGLAGAVLALVQRTGAAPWLGSLALPDDTGEPRRADELVLPGGALRALLAPEAPLGVLDPAVVAAHPAAALRAVGVLDSFAVLDDPHPDGPDHELDGEELWWAEIGGAGGDPPALLAVRDLDLVDDRCWLEALRTIAADPAGLAALRQPGGYTGWWLARHARLGGHPPPYWRLPGALTLDGLFDPVQVLGPATDAALLAAAGVRTGLSVTGPADAADLLARLADPARAVTPAVVHAAHAALVAADLDPAEVEPPARVRVMTGEVAEADRVLVLDRPWLAAVLPASELVAGGDPGALADLLDLALASEQVQPDLLGAGAGRSVRWAELVEVVAVCAAAGLPVPEGSLWLHEQLRVRRGEVEHPVPFWVTPDGAVHAADAVRAALLFRPVDVGGRVQSARTGSEQAPLSAPRPA
ncbi:MAG: sacsin N-terminal ATP-binding-like domain-containing protein [Pseudonocardiaceae bacterium]